MMAAVFMNYLGYNHVLPADFWNMSFKKHTALCIFVIGVCRLATPFYGCGN